jgi:hypothetical protein
MNNTHVVKSWKEFFGAIIAGERTHELRRDDRGYKIGDLLELHEFDSETGRFTGRTSTARITSVTSKDEPCAASAQGLHPDFCILSIHVLSKAEPVDNRMPAASKPNNYYSSRGRRPLPEGSE